VKPRLRKFGYQGSSSNLDIHQGENRSAEIDCLAVDEADEILCYSFLGRFLYSVDLVDWNYLARLELLGNGILWIFNGLTNTDGYRHQKAPRQEGCPTGP
jgi:hypothetical protein